MPQIASTGSASALGKNHPGHHAIVPAAYHKNELRVGNTTFCKDEQLAFASGVNYQQWNRG